MNLKAMDNRVFLGIDTSNYTTSLAVCGFDGEILYQVKEPLPVKDGECGLRQSDALFAHTKNLPVVFAKAKEILKDKLIVAVGVSENPRRAEGSYMPCFLAGISCANAVASACGCELYGFSHQEGHIAAALYSAGKLELIGERFAAFHLSGGTTDIILAEPSESEAGFTLQRIGGTLDINCGQAIDRAGVMMGMHFPCGCELERACMAYDGDKIGTAVSVKGLDCNLSGLQNKAQELWFKCGDKNAVAALVFEFIGKTIERLTDNLRGEYKDIPIIYAGGVMSSSVLSSRLKRRFDGIHFAEPVYSSDNACGVAVLASRRYRDMQK